MRRIKYLILICIISSFGCAQKSKENNAKYYKKSHTVNIAGKNLSSVKNIIGDSIKSNSSNLFLIFVASGYDCSSCIENGLLLLNEHYEILRNKNIKPYCIISSGNTFYLQKKRVSQTISLMMNMI
ncbi:hypothetical protein [Carboxylicivirga sp. N1Y90]|uniref:hypothetical protein n=1 Tax=Carboxylicivirga fragile TaxID=3417571 RepID=UPI003D33D88F|nr:hypothetical protein [Marinilabiliaceae bacterium N1Y90]